MVVRRQSASSLLLPWAENRQGFPRAGDAGAGMGQVSGILPGSGAGSPSCPSHLHGFSLCILIQRAGMAPGK